MSQVQLATRRAFKFVSELRSTPGMGGIMMEKMYVVGIFMGVFGGVALAAILKYIIQKKIQKHLHCTRNPKNGL